MIDEDLTAKVIKCAIAVHTSLGPGLLESAYRECLCHELKSNSLKVVKEKAMPIVYESIKLDHGYRMDLLVESRLVIELKTVESITDVHLAQVLTYLKLGNFPVGLLINFHVKKLKDGLRRVINNSRAEAV